MIWILYVFIFYFIVKFFMIFKRVIWKRSNNVTLSVGFFHPYCNAGGGGERVLWCAIRTIQKRYKNIRCVIYTGDQEQGKIIVENAQKSFNVFLPEGLQIVHLRFRCLVEAKYYPYFTLLGQSLGSVLLGMEAAFYHVPDIYIDTMGYAWTYPIFRYLCSCYVAAYVHYPTISTDMLSSVSEKKVTVNNKEFISNSILLSNAKILYYKLFALLYYFMGQMAEVIMVNSSWTHDHILKLWKKPSSTFIVYPPCDTSVFEKLPLKPALNRNDLRIISIAQFRPEKNHELQIDAFKDFLDRIKSVRNCAKLILIGSCRHNEDYERVNKLKLHCSEIGIEEMVEFKLNLTFKDVIEEMKNADIALHSMWNEHFGIGIVECMSAGLIMIAHDSGGPKLDIVTDGKTGFLARDIKSYADALESVWNMKSTDLIEMRKNARSSVTRFSVDNFEESFLSAVSLVLGNTNM